MTNPGMMPRKLPDHITKVHLDNLDEFVREVKEPSLKITAKPQEREVPREALAAALGGSPLANDIDREVKWQKRHAKKNQAIARINRKRRPKKR